MKPHEETWVANWSVRGPESVTVIGAEGREVDVLMLKTSDRARLAAQAPVMARLLLQVVDDSAHGYAHSVDGLRCRKIADVLRAAGVLE